MRPKSADVYMLTMTTALVKSAVCYVALVIQL